MEESIKIETSSGPKPMYEVSTKSLGKIVSKLSGLFFYREDEGKIIVKPVSDRIYNYMVHIVGADNLTYIGDE